MLRQSAGSQSCGAKQIVPNKNPIGNLIPMGFIL
jgi:hypothetical protein